MSKKITTISNSDTSSSFADLSQYNSSTRGEKDKMFTNFVSYIQNKVNNLQDKITESEKREIDSSKRNIEILSIFITFFTFISVETQIFRNGIAFLSGVGFSIMILGVLLVFLFFLKIVDLNELEIGKKRYLLLLLVSLAIIFIATGIFLMYQGENKYVKEKNDDIKKMIDENIKNSEVSFKNCVKLNQSIWPCVK